VTRPIFKEYVREAVLKYVNTTREMTHLDDFAGVLLCDKCSSHIDEEVMVMLARENIRLMSFPPHTFHRFQPLDLATFAAFKREKRGIHINDQTYEGIGACHGFIQQPRGLQTSWVDDHPRLFPPVSLVDSRSLIEMINASGWCWG
jgi:hypothetical protein